MTKHIKFELEELPKSNVVNSKIHAISSDVEQIINEAVADHISAIVEEDSDDEPEKETLNAPAEEAPAEEAPVITTEAQSDLDIESIKQEAYNRGVEETTKKLGSANQESVIKNDYSALLLRKLEAIIPEVEIDSQIAKVSAESISGIAKKLHLILPANFEEIITNGLIGKLKSFYKEGTITLTIHPNKYDFCAEALQSDTIPSKFKENFQIIKDDKIGEDDCKLEWNDTKLEYSQEQLAAEIDKIIEQLKSATN